MPLKDLEARKAYQKAASKKHYENNKPHYLKRVRKHQADQRERLKQYRWQYLTEHPCVDCGEKDPRVLQFDHVKDKKESISILVNRGASLSTLQTEIAKCEIRCANCHQKKTSIQFGWWTPR